MNISSPHDVSYNARWTRGYLEVFQDGKSIGKVRISTRETAKEVFEVVVKKSFLGTHNKSEHKAGVNFTE